MRLKFQAEDNFKLAYLLQHTLKHRNLIFSKITILDFKMCFLVTEAKSQYLKNWFPIVKVCNHPSIQLELEPIPAVMGQNDNLLDLAC